MGSDLGLLPRSRGTLKFSLFYCRERCELLLTGLEAWGLPSHGCAESAVRVRLLRQVPSHIPGLQEWQSRVVKNCSRPAFGDHFIFSLQDDEVEKSTLKLEVRWGASSVDIKEGALTREDMCNGFWRHLTPLRNIEGVSHQVLSEYSQPGGWPFGNTNKTRVANHQQQQREWSESLEHLPTLAFKGVPY